MKKNIAETSNPPVDRLPDSELEIMRVLWRSGKPLRSVDIVRNIPSCSWKAATAHVLLDRLCERGCVRADKNGSSRLFTPLISEEEYRAAESGTLLRRLCGGSLKTLVASLIDADEVSADELRELAELIEAKRLGEK